MPPVQLFGRPWHFAGDDLALPAAVGVGFHSGWSAVIVVGLAKLGPSSVECSELHLLQRFAAGLLGFFLLTALLDALVCIVSLRGAAPAGAWGRSGRERRRRRRRCRAGPAARPRPPAPCARRAGSLLEQHKRRSLPALLYAMLASTAGIIGVNSYGTLLSAATSCR
jgi:hypothetical protein